MNPRLTLSMVRRLYSLRGAGAGAADSSCCQRSDQTIKARLVLTLETGQEFNNLMALQLAA